MNKVFQAAMEISDFMAERGWKFATIVARQRSLDVKYLWKRLDEMCDLSSSREIMDRAYTILEGKL